MSVRKYGESAESLLFKRRTVSITGSKDHLTILVFLAALAISIFAGVLLMLLADLPPLDLALFVTAPLVILGVFHVVRSGHTLYLLLVAASAAALLVANYLVMDVPAVEYPFVMVLVLISVGTIGVVELVSVLQKEMFYRVVGSVEYLNVKTRLSLFDRVVAFVFNISGDLDTRNLNADIKVKRASLPWGDIWASLKISFIIGMFIWIYISMNPSWMSMDPLSRVPLYMFVMMLYVPVLVLPFSIFMSLNVRIETRYRDFRIYDGIKGTLMRMAVPVFAAFMYILAAVNENGLYDVLAFIVMSVAFNFLICVATCLVYYRWFEKDVVDSITSAWELFRPVQMLMIVDDADGKAKDDVPGTPKRDYSDFGELVFPEDLT